ncbi:MAG: toxin TumE, partial [Dolichospermum sp.]
LNQVEQVVLMYSNVYVERYEEEILTPNRANIKIRLRFHQTHLLEINEAIVVANNQLQFLDYRYHFQNEHNYLIFRYDTPMTDY